MSASTLQRTVSVIICAYTMQRYDALCAAIRSVQLQSTPPEQIIIVADNSPILYHHIRDEYPEITVIENTEERGLSGARNSGIAHCTTDIVAFLDDDAEADPNWLSTMHDTFSTEDVMSVGGQILPAWNQQAPRWLPEEFFWVVGCTYRGMPTQTAPIRNAIGANMAFRREVFDAIGGFRSGVGRVGTLPLGCEETELSIRAQQHWPDRTIMYQPAAIVHHHVLAERGRWSYFVKRCYAEGLSKATIARFVGAQQSLASERTYTMQTLPDGVKRNLGALLHGDRFGGARATAIVLGLLVTMLGYLVGKLAPHARTAATSTTPATATPAVDQTPSVVNVVATPNFHARRIIETELAEPIPALAAINPANGEQYEYALGVIRLHHKTLGMVEVKLGDAGVSADDYAHQIWQTLQPAIIEHLQHDGLPLVTGLDASGVVSHEVPVCHYEMDRFLQNAPFASVIVTTHGDSEHLRQALSALCAQAYSRFEIVVADVSRQRAIHEVARTMSNARVTVRYISGESAGHVALLHNHAIRIASGSIIAFTDDAATVDRHWLASLVHAFGSADNVACVTGLVLPKEYETAPQQWMEEYGGYGKGFARKTFTQRPPQHQSALYPFNAGIFGTGISMAFTAAFLREHGGFDVALDASHDLALFRSVITSGATLIYEPDALLYYQIPRSYTALLDRMSTYGAGLGAYVVQTLLSRPSVALRGLVKAPQALYYLFSPWSAKNRKQSRWYPREILHTERKGMVLGALGYLRSRLHLAPVAVADELATPASSPVTYMTMPNLSVTRGSDVSTANYASQRARTLLTTLTEHRTMLVNGLSMIGTTGITSLLGFLYWWAAARHFTPDAIGFASALVSVISLVGLLCMFGFGTMLMGELPRDPQHRESLISASLLFVGGAAGVAGLLFALIAPAISVNFAPLRANPGIMLLFVLGVSLSAVTLVLDQALIGLLLGGQQLWRNTIFATVKLGFLLTLTLSLASRGGVAIFATWVGGFVVSLLVMLGIGLARRGVTIQSTQPDWARLKRLGGRAFQHHVLNTILLAANQLLPIIVTITLSVRSNAWFYLSFSLANLVFMIAYSLSTALYAINAADTASLTQRLRITMGLSFVAVFVANIVVTFGATAILGIYGHAYADAGAWSLRLLCLAAFPEIVRMHYVALQRIHNTMRTAMVPLAIGGVCEITLAIIGAHFGGLTGLCIGWLVALTCQAVYMSPTVLQALNIITPRVQNSQDSAVTATRPMYIEQSHTLPSSQHAS